MSLLTVAIVPVIIFLFAVYQKDTEKEPLNLLFKGFVGGMLSIFPAVALATGFQYFNTFYNPMVVSFYDAFFVAAIPEELAKFALLFFIIWKNKAFDQHYDGIIYAVFVSLGFAVVENILYVFEHGMETAILRAVLAIPAHGFFGVAMGYFFALAKFSERRFRKKNLALCLLIPILLHGTYDFALMYMAVPDISVPEIIGLLALLAFVIVRLWKFGIRRIRKHILKDKIEISLLKEDENNFNDENL